MPTQLSRRAALVAAGALAVSGPPRPIQAQPATPAYGYPMGFPGQPLGDGLLVRHGYAVENIPHYPGWWHTGENWHAVAGESAGLGVYAVSAGEIVYAGFDYPGRVVIVAHPDGLYAMYGHLDYALAVESGQSVTRGQMLGTVLRRDDEPARSHLHFELRAFLTRPEVNGDAPQHGVTCGYRCPPGPGYWPMAAPEHPSHLGWRNPTHVIARRAWSNGIPTGTEVVVSLAAPASMPLWSAPPDIPDAEPLEQLPLTPGDRYPLLALDAGAEDTTGTSAEAYRLWYQIALPNGVAAWIQAAVPRADYAGSDGRPAAVRFDFLPLLPPPGA